MDELNEEGVKRLLEEVYALPIQEEYGVNGVARLKQLALGLDRIYRHLAYEKLSGGFTVLRALDDDAELVVGEELLRLAPEDLPAYVEEAATIQVLPDGDLLLIPSASDPLEFAKEAVVYHFDGADNFVYGGALQRVINTGPLPSIFGTPTFFRLAKALHAYRLHHALHSQCPILRAGLWSDNRRWFLANSPEDVAQDSLHNYLRTTLRGIREVRREQKVDKRPVDLKISWALVPRIAYIEIKWMGQSTDPENIRISTTFNASAAKKGAKQLADYLEANKQEAPTYDTMGYLVVFDARRRSLKFDSATLSAADAHYFRAREVAYDPEFHKSRPDFAPPLRFFLEPAQIDG
jgi:hypothetical protein